MSLNLYKKYKKSSVEWLGDIPEHWKIGKFRHAFIESNEKIEDAVVGQMLSVSGYRGIEIKEYDDENRRRLDEDLIGYRIVRTGQLVVNTMWLNYAGLGVSDFEGHVSPAYRSYWISEKLEKRFLHYLMRSDRYVKGYTKFLTGVRPNSLQMSRDDLMEFPILQPSREEQIAIAIFLDWETVKIDTLISEKQRLIELLKEKRQAVISHAVSKGLNPNVSMKDSGIEWLGEVPKHWGIVPLKIVASHNDTVLDENSDPDKEILYVDISSVNEVSGITTKEAMLYAKAPSRARRKVRHGDVIISTVRTYLRAIARIRSPEDNLIVSTGFAVIRPTDRITSDFLGYVLLANFFVEQVIARSVGVSYPAINASELVCISITLPPTSKQIDITTYLDCETAKIDALIAEADKAISLLRERRTSLISSAVTGKIDVRGTTKQEIL